MSNNRTVSKRDNGSWANKRNGTTRASDLHATQQQAIDAAKQQLLNSGGGDLTVMGRDGQIRSKDTIGRPDPNPPKDKEH